ncbi:unnamed protein product [Durusdinium trenchii]|uniref:Uncharacterized protein n=1 Tax=Durusdinium trenchii TaxID=1381693 RepID=A0ABP0QI12_9DINO
MNGLSFAEFENSSFDDLYSKGFANAKHLEQVSKELQHLKPGAPAALSFGRTAQAVDAAPLHARADTAQVRRLPTPAAARDPRADRGAAVVPLNDLGVMPGNSHVDHAWRPSKDAHLQMKGGPSSQPTEARRPSNQACDWMCVGGREPPAPRSTALRFSADVSERTRAIG